MQKMNTRIGVRISKTTRRNLDKAIREGKAKNLSAFIKNAIDTCLAPATDKEA